MAGFAVQIWHAGAVRPRAPRVEGRGGASLVLTSVRCVGVRARGASRASGSDRTMGGWSVPAGVAFTLRRNSQRRLCLLPAECVRVCVRVSARVTV